MNNTPVARECHPPPLGSSIDRTLTARNKVVRFGTWDSDIAAERGQLLSVQYRAHVKPLSALLLHPGGGSGRAPIAFGIESQRRCRRRVPNPLDRIDDSPGEFDLVASREEAGIALHGIEEETLVCLGHIAGEFRLEAKVQIRHTKLHSGIGDLGLELELNAFSGLDLQDEPIRIEGLDRFRVEHQMRAVGGTGSRSVWFGTTTP